MAEAKIEIRGAGAWCIGAQAHQQDSYGLVEAGADEGEPWLTVVADSLGGMLAGNGPSRSVVERFIATFQGAEGSVADRLNASLAAANGAIESLINKDWCPKGMGATLAAAAVTTTQIEWVSVGSCLLWLWRDGTLRRLNADHSMKPVIEDILNDPQRDDNDALGLNPHRLRSALLGEDILMVDRSPDPVPLTPGDRVLLATDGLETLDESTIGAIVGNDISTNPERTVRALLSAVQGIDDPGQDNATVVLLWLDPPPSVPNPN